VWDYPRPPRVELTTDRVVVEHAGRVVADTTASLRVLETSQPPTFYLPAADIDTELLVPSRASTTVCEWKGVAAYLDVVVGSVVAASDVGPRIHALLALDIDEQRVNPLALVREAVRYPTEVLRAAEVRPVHRDEFAARQFPDDDYDLTPTSFGEIDPDLHEPGLVWGAAKAHVHLSRRRAAGQR